MFVTPLVNLVDDVHKKALDIRYDYDDNCVFNLIAAYI